MSAEVAVGKLNEDVASSAVMAKLLIFALSLGILPIATYFGSMKFFWQGNATYAAITSIVCANIVLVAYIIFSILDDKRTTPPAAPDKKTQ
ncbi:hypothetical protein C8J57DRAFT_1053820 [Mycena rebaudengoi]|nr:hypothetical protein C8J57DRAFT_1053820 [Mycena rebaudengoi]